MSNEQNWTATNNYDALNNYNALVAKLAGVRALHGEYYAAMGWCTECENAYPCPTVRIIDGDPEMSNELGREALTDAEWRAFQAIPERGYSHRAWVNFKIYERLAIAAITPNSLTLAEVRAYIERLRESVRPGCPEPDIGGGACGACRARWAMCDDMDAILDGKAGP